MCVMWNSAVKGQILKNQAVTEVLNLENYFHPCNTWKSKKSQLKDLYNLKFLNMTALKTTWSYNRDKRVGPTTLLSFWLQNN